MKSCLTLLLYLFISSLSFSESIYIPIDIQKAYEKGSRSKDGKTGENYWQNSSHYKIDVSFDPKTSSVSGKETITYYNNSPNDIDYIVLRLYQNHFKKGMSRNRSIHPDDVNNGMEITYLRSPSDSITSINYAGTNLFVYLKNYLSPSDSIVLKIHWNFELPIKENQRFGGYNGGWFIGLWYPQIAVYDDVFGWDTYNFEWEQEFYNDFNNYDVNITLPRGYIVQATGELSNPVKTLSSKIYEKYKEAQNSDSVVHIITKKDLAINKLTQKHKNIVWNFKADHIPDFAFCTSNQYLWDGQNVPLNNGSESKNIFVNTLYHPESKDFKKVNTLASEYIKYSSEDFPGILFPYSKMTIFNGEFGGMEYPMIVNNISSNNEYFTVLLTTHEIAHTYFPFLTGINERKYAWMDEGWAETLPIEFQKSKVPTHQYHEEIISMYETQAGKESDLVPMTPTVFYGENATMPYRILSYFRSGTAFLILKDLLGPDLFQKALVTFIENWKGKHPLPYDFFFSFDKSAGEDLSWFWNPWFFEQGYPELELSNVENSDNTLNLEVTKNGNIPVPLHIKIVYTDDTSEQLHFTAKVWKSSNKFIHRQTVDREVSVVTITNDLVPDVDKSNNTYHFNFQ